MAKICQKCGAENLDSMKQCGNCGGQVEGAQTTESLTEERWSNVLGRARGSEEAPVIEDLGSEKREKAYGIATMLFAISLALMVLGFLLSVYSNERIEVMYSGDLDDMMSLFDDLEDIAKAAKWGSYLLNAGLISAVGGLLFIAIGLQHSRR